MRVHRRNTQWLKGNKNEMYHFCFYISFLQVHRSCLADTFKSAQRHKCHTCMRTTHMRVCHIHPYVHSRPQRPRSFWSAPRIATSDQVQRHSSFELICKHNRLRPELIRFVRLDSEHCRVTGSPWIADFRCWTWSEVGILGADQKEPGLWDENVIRHTCATPTHKAKRVLIWYDGALRFQKTQIMMIAHKIWCTQMSHRIISLEVIA